MEAIEVTARFSLQGNIVPLQFQWKGKQYKVDSVGRSWQTGDGHHLLVMNTKMETFHLFFKSDPPGWYLVRSITPTNHPA